MWLKVFISIFLTFGLLFCELGIWEEWSKCFAYFVVQPYCLWICEEPLLFLFVVVVVVLFYTDSNEFQRRRWEDIMEIEVEFMLVFYLWWWLENHIFGRGFVENIDTRIFHGSGNVIRSTLQFHPLSEALFFFCNSHLIFFYMLFLLIV